MDLDGLVAYAHSGVDLPLHLLPLVPPCSVKVNFCTTIYPRKVNWCTAIYIRKVNSCATISHPQGQLLYHSRELLSTFVPQITSIPCPASPSQYRAAPSSADHTLSEYCTPPSVGTKGRQRHHTLCQYRASRRTRVGGCYVSTGHRVGHA
eukprot:3940851-Rhodomonas_salina.2